MSLFVTDIASTRAHRAGVRRAHRAIIVLARA
jgi:hypothetical protein